MMRIILSILLVCSSLIPFAQTNSDSISICKISLKVPDSITVNSEYEIRGKDFSMNWLYMEKNLLDTVPKLFVNQMAQKQQKFSKTPIKLFILDEPANGFKISYDQENHKAYQIIAYGKVNEQPVMIQLLMQKDPKNNTALPAFVRKIIRLEK